MPATMKKEILPCVAMASLRSTKTMAATTDTAATASGESVRAPTFCKNAAGGPPSIPIVDRQAVSIATSKSGPRPLPTIVSRPPAKKR